MSTQLTLVRNDEEWIRCSSETNTRLFTYQVWFDFNVKIATGFNFLQKLLEGKVLFVVDGSFCPKRFSFISAGWHASVDNKIVGRGDFIYPVSERHRHPHVAELRCVLSIMVGIYSVLSRYPYPSNTFEIEIKSDYQSLIHSIWNTLPVITLNTHLRQICREIGLIRDEWLAMIVAVKIKDH